MPRQRSPKRQRIGFLSSWFCNSAIGRLCAGLIALLDRSKFEVRVFVVRDGKGSVRRDLFTDEIADSADRAEVLPHPLWEAQQVLSAAGLDALIFTDVGMEPFSRISRAPFLLSRNPEDPTPLVGTRSRSGASRACRRCSGATRRPRAWAATRWTTTY